MKSPFKVHQSVYFALGILIMKSVSLLMLPIVTYYLSPKEFGELELLISISDFATIIVGFGMADALYRFAGLSKSDDEEKNIGATIFSLTIITGITAFLLGLVAAPYLLPLLGGDIELFDVQLVVFLFAVDGMLVIPLSWLKMKENAFTFFVLTTGKAICQAFVSWQLLKADWGLTSILMGGAVSSIILVLILARIQFKETGFRFDSKLLPELLLYGTPLVVSAMAAYALLSADRWMINMVSTQEELGLYAVGKKLAYISFILIQPFCLWWSAIRFKKLNEPDGKTEVAKTTSLGIALAVCFCALVIIGSPIVLDLLINEQYAKAIHYLPMLALIFAVKQVAELANIGCYVGKTTWNVMGIDLFSAAVSIGGLFYLSSIWGIYGVIASLLLSQVTRFICFYVVSQRKLHLQYDLGKLTVLIAICTAMSYVSLQLSNILAHFSMLVFSSLFLLAYLHFTNMFNMTPLIKRCVQMVRKPTPV